MARPAVAGGARSGVTVAATYALPRARRSPLRRARPRPRPRARSLSVLTLYPAVDIKDGRAVRLTQGRADAETVYDVDPVAAAQRFADAGSTWLHVVDLDAAFTGEPRNRHLIEAIVAATGCRVQASGGVRTVEDVEASLSYGAERVVIGTMALTDPGSWPRCSTGSGPGSRSGWTPGGRPCRPAGGPRRPATSSTLSSGSPPWASRGSCTRTWRRTACSRAPTSTCCAGSPTRRTRPSPLRAG
jgi:hypothetical protein